MFTNDKISQKKQVCGSTYDFGARHCDARIARWEASDPLAEDYEDLSPYNYVANSPLNNIDPDGMGLLDGFDRGMGGWTEGGGGGGNPYVAAAGALLYGFKDLLGGQADIGLDRRYAIGRQPAKIGARVVNSGTNQPNDIIFVLKGNNGSVKFLKYKKGDFYWTNNGQKYNGTGANNTLWRLLKQYRRIENSQNKALKARLHRLEKSPRHHYVADHGTVEFPNNNSVVPNGIPEQNGQTGSSTLYDFYKQESYMGTTVYEMRHEYDFELGNTKDSQHSSAKDPSQIRAVHDENIGRAMDNFLPRTDYGGEKINPKALKNPPNYVQ